MVQFSVAILAGGKSSRMGVDKSFVPLLGQPMIEQILARVSGLGQAETILITNRPAAYAHLNLPVYTDVIQEKGSLGGIYSALVHSQSDFTLVVACDMPFVNADLLRYMLTLCTGFDVTVPRTDGHPQGLHAVYRKTCLEPIHERLKADRLKVIGFYDSVQVRYLDEPEYLPLDPQKLSFQNINTPQELEAAQLLQQLDQNRIGPHYNQLRQQRPLDGEP
jgi:molybdopterin-guanine dinucleotide biosynthesis protein A